MSAPRPGASGIAALLAFAACLARLPEAGLQFLDSWCYARVSVEMAASGDWVIPTWRGQTFLEKPPLLFWLTAALFRITDMSEFAARALAGAASAGCVLLVFRLGAAAGGSACGLAAALLLCATPMFLKWGRTYGTDPLFALLNLAALACGWRAARAPALWPAAGALAALAALTRGAAAAPLLVTLAFLVWDPPRPPENRPRRAWILLSLGILLLLAVPWHLAAAARAGTEFLRVYLGEHTLRRALENLIDSPRTAGPLYYLSHLLRTAWPVLPLWAWGLGRLSRGWRPSADPAGRLDRALLFHTAAQAAMLALVSSRSPRYLLPLYPVLALLAARGLAGSLGGAAAARLRRGAAGAAALGAIVIAVWPGPVGTPRGEPFRAVAAALEREAPGRARLEVDAALLDPWFERAFWFYLGRAPLPGPGPSAGGGEPGAAPARPLLRLGSAASAAACLPPACRVLERAGPYVLTRLEGPSPHP